MKYLLLIRHAKTEQSGYDHDFERELTDRGMNDCKRMSACLKKIGFVPNLVKVSNAKRTRQTAKQLTKHSDWDKDKIEHLDNLYLASYKTILHEIAATKKNVDSLVVISHNPGITELFNHIGNATIDNLPTCGMGLFAFEINDWKDMLIQKGKLEWYSWPKKVKS